MLAKVRSFDAQNGHLPLKIGGAILGSVIASAIVFAVVSALESDEEFEVYDSVDDLPADEID